MFNLFYRVRFFWLINYNYKFNMLFWGVGKYIELRYNSIKKWGVKNLNINKLKIEVCNCLKVD